MLCYVSTLEGVGLGTHVLECASFPRRIKAVARLFQETGFDATAAKRALVGRTLCRPEKHERPAAVLVNRRFRFVNNGVQHFSLNLPSCEMAPAPSPPSSPTRQGCVVACACWCRAAAERV